MTLVIELKGADESKSYEAILKQKWARRQRKSPETVSSSIQHWGGTPSWRKFWLRFSTYKGKKKKIHSR